MLIREKLPQGYIYPQITQIPENYGDFLATFRGGHTLDDNVNATSIASTIHAAMLKIGVNSGHLKKTNNLLFPNGLMDVFLTKEGAELIQTAVDRKFSAIATAEAYNSIAEDDGELHPYVGAVVVRDGQIIAKGYRGETGEGRHAEYCALRKINDDVDAVDLTGCTVYTTLEPCSMRKPGKTPCTNRLINGKVARVVYGLADKDETVFGHSTLVEAKIEIGVFPHELIQELQTLNQKWSDSRRAKKGIPPPNDTSPLAVFLITNWERRWKRTRTSLCDRPRTQQGNMRLVGIIVADRRFIDWASCSEDESARRLSDGCPIRSSKSKWDDSPKVGGSNPPPQP